MKFPSNFLLWFLLITAPALGQLPDAPSATPHKSDFAVRRWDEPALRSNKQTLQAVRFLLPHALAWTAAIVDARRNRHSFNAPQGREIYLDALLPAAAVTGLGFVSDRYIWRPISWGLAAYLGTIHVRGSVMRHYP